MPSNAVPAPACIAPGAAVWGVGVGVLVCASPTALMLIALEPCSAAEVSEMRAREGVDDPAGVVGSPVFVGSCGYVEKVSKTECLREMYGGLRESPCLSVTHMRGEHI